MAQTMSVRVSTTECQYEGKDFLTLCVGQPSTILSIEKPLAISRSEFFQKATRGEWREARSNWIRMREDDPATVRKYLHILRTDKVAVSYGIVGFEDETEETGNVPILDFAGRNQNPSQQLIDVVHAEYNGLAQLYVFCEKMLDSVSKRIIMAAMIEAVHQVRRNGMVWFPPSTAIAAIFHGTVAKDPMRHYIVDVYVNHGHIDSLPDGDEAYHPDFFSMAARALMARRKGPENTTGTERIDRYLEE